MNKKLIATVGTVALGGVLLGSTAYAAISGTSGYDLYKQALKNTHEVQAMTPKTEVVVLDNGQQVIKVDAVSKVDTVSKTGSQNIQVDTPDGQKQLNIYMQEGKTVVKSADSQVYSILESNGKNFHKDWKQDDTGRLKDIENVIDAMAGNLQNFIGVQENTDGTKSVSLQLTDSQISPVIHAVTSLVANNLDLEHGNKGATGGFHDSLKVNLPKLVDNIKVSKIDVAAEINQDNLIAEQTQKFVITGNDAEGKSHELVISINMEFVDYNSTTPDKVDLTGKQIKVIEHQFKHHK